MPSISPGRGARVVADTASSSSGTRSRRPRISVPLPTPDGPVITNTSDTPESAAQHGDQLGALALRQPADRLARRDAALQEDLVDLHAPVLGHREQHVEDLGRLDVFGRIQEQVVDADSTALEVA